MESFHTPHGLSNYREEKLQFTPFGGWSQTGLLRRPSCRNYRKPYIVCLTLCPGEISHSNSAHRELSNDVLVVVVRRRKVALHTSSHLMPIEAWRSAVSTTSHKLADWNGLKILPRQIFSACVKFGGNPCRDDDTLRFYTHTHTQTDRHTDTHTYTNEIIY